MTKTYELKYMWGATIESVTAEAIRALSKTGRTSEAFTIEDSSKLCDARTGQPVNLRYNYMTGLMEGTE